MKTLTLDEARAVIRDYWNSAEDDTSHLSMGQIFAPLVAAYTVLVENGDAFDCRIAADLVEAVPAVFDYDARGNWIGTVANENGWTA